MRKVIFFVDYEWALGSIHYELCKHLWMADIDAQVLPWHRVYNSLEIQELDANTDLWVTLPQGWDALKSYGINRPEKVALVAHAVVDLHKMKTKIPHDEFMRFKRTAAVSQFLCEKAWEIDVPRVLKNVPVGINVDRFRADPSLSLKTVGYGGVFMSRQDSAQPTPGQELEPRFSKRSYLAEEAAKEAGLKFSAASTYHTSYMGMPTYYRNVDCVIIPSLEEGAGMPALEAGAAGRLVIGTAVGHWMDRIGSHGGIAVSKDETEFMRETVRLLKFYRDNPLAYQDKCWEIHERAMAYDWHNFVPSWVKLVT
jgi:glycosyltransferase involved in cell wall biosynthesis